MRHSQSFALAVEAEVAHHTVEERCCMRTDRTEVVDIHRRIVEAVEEEPAGRVSTGPRRIFCVVIPDTAVDNPEEVHSLAAAVADRSSLVVDFPIISTVTVKLVGDVRISMTLPWVIRHDIGAAPLTGNRRRKVRKVLQKFGFTRSTQFGR